jgi:serine/threonine protein kinase
MKRNASGALIAGVTLNSRYRIVEMIGEGSFGAVYKAVDKRFPSKLVVALKEMSDFQLSPDEKVKALQSFYKEADLLAQLKHPNLPKVSDVFEEDGKAYLVMEFIEGKTLVKIQEGQNGPLDEHLVMG